MKSRTSFFNLTLYKKDITRFVPLWVLYTVGLTLLMLSSTSLNQYFDDETARTLNGAIGPLGIMNLLYGVLTAQLLFGELFNARLCNALHAMPVTREARFGSHLLAALSFSVVPNLLVSLLMMPYLHQWYLALLWLLALTLQFLFFFGTAVFAMLCTGNRFAASLVYAIINFGSMAALWFADVIFLPLMPGVVLDWEGFAYFSPVVQMCRTGGYLLLERSAYGGQWEFKGMGSSWVWLVIYAAVGVAVLVGALLIYRRRALESAGDFIAVKVLKPVFLVLYTLCAGAFLAVFGSLFMGDPYLVFLIVGLIVGFFTGKMLIERTIRIFNIKSFIQLGIFVVLMWLALQAVQFDVFGIVRYVPNPGAVKQAQVVSYHYGSNNVTVSQTAELEILQEAHKLALEEETCKHADMQFYQITYHMKDGRTVKREYQICRQGQAAVQFEKLFHSPEAIFGYKGHWDDYTRSVTSIRVTGIIRREFLDADTWINFLDHLHHDCTSGALGSQGGKQSRFEVTIWSDGGVVTIPIRENSMAYDWLESYEKRDMLKYLEEIDSITLKGKELEQAYEIDPELYDKIVNALYDDVRENIYTGWDIFDQKEWDPVYELHIKTEFGTPEVLYIGEYVCNSYEWIKEYVTEMN